MGPALHRRASIDDYVVAILEFRYVLGKQQHVQTHLHKEVDRHSFGWIIVY